MSTASIGASRERLVRDYLCGTPEDSKAARQFPGFGWIHLQRSAASKGAVDQSFVRRGHILLVQVKKTGSAQISPGERAGLIKLADEIGLDRAIPVSCWWPTRAKLPEFRLITGPGPKDWIQWTPDGDLISYQKPGGRVVLSATLHSGKVLPGYVEVSA